LEALPRPQDTEPKQQQKTDLKHKESDRPSDRGKDSKIILAAFHFLPFTRTLSLSPYPVMHDIDVDKVIDSVQSLKKDLTEDSDDIKLSES
jgi:hypothetical protein